MDVLPARSEDLIEILDKEFPEKKTVPGMTLEEVMYNAGKRRIVDFLKLKLEEAEQVILERVGG